MNVEVGASITIREPTEAVKQWCQDNLTLDNPEYAKKVRMGFWTGNTPKVIRLYRTEDDALIMPFGCLCEVLKLTAGYPVKSTFCYKQEMDFGGEVPLYGYQQAAVTIMYTAQYGILQSPAGSGKTQMGLALAAMWKMKTLWLTHTKDLLNQSKERAERYFSPEDMGTITEGKVEVGRLITFATVQTMCNIDLDLYRDTWNVIIVDECHRCVGSPTAVTMFSKVLNHLRARHKYGLSATVHRADGLIRATFALLGQVQYIVPAEAVADKVMQVTIQPVDTGIGLDREYLNGDGTINYAKMLTWLGENEQRNTQILHDLVENKFHSNLILSDRVEHLKRLYDGLPPVIRERAAMIDGKMVSKKAKAERLMAIEQMRTGELRYLFATYALAKEGLDIPRLDRLYLTTPQKDYAVITQAIGRVARTFDGKTDPVVYDYIDNLTFLEKSFKKRRTSYKKAGCIIRERI